jgi:hypothetical protein
VVAGSQGKVEQMGADKLIAGSQNIKLAERITFGRQRYVSLGPFEE